jgi:hypothetical protein
VNAFVILSAWCAFYGFCIGICFGAVYDVLRVRRIAFSKERYGIHRAQSALSNYFDVQPKGRFWSVQTIVIALEDFLFLSFLGAAIAILTFYENDGVFRWYALLACILGFACYRVTLGALVMKAADAIIARIKVCFRFVIAHTLVPLRQKQSIAWRKIKRAVFYRYAQKQTQLRLHAAQKRLSLFSEQRGRKIKTKEAE